MSDRSGQGDGKKILLLLFPTFSEFEVTVATAILRNQYDLVTVALQAGPVSGESGLQCLPHRTIDQIDPDAYEGLIIPGGDMIHLERARPLFDLVRALHERGRLLAAICSGGYVLAKAGLLATRPYTVTFTAEQRAFLGCFDEAYYRYEPLVEDGNIITAQGHAYVEFGLRVGEYLGAASGRAVQDFYRGVRNHSMLLIS